VYVLNSTMSDRSPEQSVSRFPPHAPSLGGSMNANHFKQDQQQQSSGSNYNNENGDWYTAVMTQKASNDNTDVVDDDALPVVSNVGTEVRSVSSINRDNKPGHYIHDPLQSPYTSPYYAEWKNNTVEQEKEQTAFETKMSGYVKKYGQWVPPKFSDAISTPDFTLAEQNKDLNSTEFPSSAWQSNREYMLEFFGQAKQLVSRVQEGIFEEYGYGISDETSTAKKNDIIAQRIVEFKVLVKDRLPIDNNGAAVNVNSGVKKSDDDDTTTTSDAIPAVAYLNTAAWEGLIRKLLHSMITSDQFYVVLVGHTNTYLGNNFQQSAVMEFNNIMEPVFDRLGMKLISRNMGMNATTTVSALGGADIYGEADVLWHVPDDRPEGIAETGAMMDFLFRQAILSGSRVPIILTPYSTPLLEATQYSAWLGNIQPGANFCDYTYTKNGKRMVPLVKACRFVKCRSDPKLCERHNSVCWVPRSDRNPQQTQDKDVGHQRKGYPSYQQQRLEGRKLAMLVLHALDEALDRWVEQEKKDALPLPDSMWHVGPVYHEIRERIRTMKSDPCGRLFRKLDPRICHVEMHAYTEWTPRIDQSRLKGRVQNVVADKQSSMFEVYAEVALLPMQWKIADNEIDVHMIAIATDTSTIQLGKDEAALQIDNDEDNSSWNDDDDAWAAHLGATGDHDCGFDDDGTGDCHSHYSHRYLLNSTDISPKMWTVLDAPLGFCDGSAQSSCNRNGLNTCLLANYNHYRAGIIGHGQSGALKLSIPGVKEGIILARFDWQLDGGPRVRNFPPDFSLTYTVDNVTRTMDRAQFASGGYDITPDLRVHVLLMDSKFSSIDIEGKTVDIEMEVRSVKTGLTPLLLLSHIYYA
jgi:hypothetical protein